MNECAHRTYSTVIFSNKVSEIKLSSGFVYLLLLTLSRNIVQ